MKRSSIVVFVVTYALFLVSTLFFKLDRVWYDALVKPAWTPPGAVIGIIWFFLFFCISLSLALLDAKYGIRNLGMWLSGAIVANWALNQAYTFFQFTQKDWFTAGIDAALIALTAYAVIALAWKKSKPAALLYLPYALWSTFATYLSFLIWSMNR